jgi:hypothetical protein
MADKKVFDVEDNKLFASSDDVKALPSFDEMGLKRNIHKA